jgi:hypothetical protein
MQLPGACRRCDSPSYTSFFSFAGACQEASRRADASTARRRGDSWVQTTFIVSDSSYVWSAGPA